MAITDYQPAAATAETYQADIRDVNAGTDTVQGRMTGLLDSDSDYMKRAETKGLQTAQSRGLLNSSMAAGAAQASAIDAALPIAQQDAQTYATTRMTNQAANNTAMQFNAGNQTDVSKFNAGQTNTSLLSGQQYEQQTGLNTQQNLAALEQQQAGFGYETQLAAQQEEIQTNLTNLDAEIQKAKDAGDFEYSQQLEAQKILAERELQNLDQTWRSGENEADRGLTEWQVGTEQAGAMDRLNVSEAGQTERSAADNEAAMARTELSESGQTERTQMSNDTSLTLEGMQQEGQTSRQILQNNSAMALQIVSDSSAMERQVQSDAGAYQRLVEQGSLDSALTTLRENAATLRTTLGIESNESIAEADRLAQEMISNQNVSQADRAYFATSYGDLTSNHTDYIYSIKTDSELAATEKNRLIAEADADYLADSQMMGTVFGIPIDIG